MNIEYPGRSKTVVNFCDKRTNVREMLASAYNRCDEAKDIISSPKGYNTGIGYMGLVDGFYFLFASESDYLEYIGDKE